MTASAVKEQRQIKYALVGFFLLVSIVAGGGLYRLGINDENDRRDDLFRFYLTLIEVVGVGGVAALLLERYKQLTAAADQRVAELAAERQRVEEQCRQMFLEARKAYDVLKEKRRRLQDLLGKHATVEDVLQTGSRETVVQLVEAGCCLIEPQLVLEALQEQSQYTRALPDRHVLSKLFRRMERAANKTSDALRADEQRTSKEAELIARFLSARGFGEDFKRAYHRVIRILLTGPLATDMVRDASPQPNSMGR